MESNWIYPILTMVISRNFPGVDVDFWTMHKVILKHSISSLYIQCFLIKYNIIMFTEYFTVFIIGYFILFGLM
jgi:hypothetical protein